MGNLFNMDNKVFSVLSKMADLFILNILFLVTCIPIFTIGAAIASMYQVTLKMVKDEESYIIKGYLAAFKSNFKKSTIIWLGAMVVGIILAVDLFITNANAGIMWRVLHILALSLSISLIIISTYVFPLQAKFENSCKNTLKNAWIMSVKHFPTTIVVVGLNSLVIVCILFNNLTLVYGLAGYTLIGFALTAYLNSYFFNKVFEKYYDQPEVEDTY